MKQIKKALMLGGIRLSDHAKEQMEKRGYTKRDIISCIMSGEKVETQFYQKKIRVVIAGSDADQLPMVVVVGKDNATSYVLVTAMPPIAEKFKSVI